MAAFSNEFLVQNTRGSQKEPGQKIGNTMGRQPLVPAALAQPFSLSDALRWRAGFCLRAPHDHEYTTTARFIDNESPWS
jgi:hypothetical protein